MKRRMACCLMLSALCSSVAGSQASSPVPSAPPPATKLEGFKPAAATIVTMGYDDLGRIGGISVDARELRDARGSVVRGVVVEVTESQYREERAFVDADEIPELIKDLDALLEVKANPTAFKSFEVRYSTRGDLQITAFSSSDGSISYAVRAGRVTTARRFISGADMQKLRATFAFAQQRLAALPPA